jgi:hypothetical protein
MNRVLNQPLGGNTMPRFGGIATMMRLPVAALADCGLESNWGECSLQKKLVRNCSQ